MLRGGSLLACLLRIIAIAVQVKAGKKRWRPVVIMHGFGAHSSEYNGLVNTIKRAYPGIYVRNLNILNGNKSELTPMAAQMELINDVLSTDVNLKGGFNFYGESQGGLEARVYVTQYNNPPVYNLISLNGPQSGIGECPEIEAKYVRQLCPDFATFLDVYAWPFCSFCGYWKDNRDHGAYIQHSKWLAKVNNEQGNHGIINQTYIRHMESLNQYMVVRAENDTVVQPSWSAFHQYWQWGDSGRNIIVPLNETEEYQNNLLGLKTLNERGDFIRKEFHGEHVGYSMNWWVANVLPMFNNTCDENDRLR
jgi:palmitoyl-protein thioesterase